MNVISGSPGGLIMGNMLRVKGCMTNVDQMVDVKVGMKFSLRQYLSNIGREYDPMTEKIVWNFRLGLGMYEVYEPQFCPIGTLFYMLELAVLDTNRYAILSTFKDFQKGIKIKTGHGSPEFKYFEIQI